MSERQPVLTAAGGLVGVQDIYRFPNGWGASVITHGPRIDLMPTRPVDENPDHFYLIEDDPLVSEWLTEETLDRVLDQLAARPWPGPPDLTRRWQSSREAGK